MSIKWGPVHHVLIADKRESVFGGWKDMLKGFFSVWYIASAGLCGAQSPPFLGQPSALLAFSSESVSHQGWERGKVSSISESGKGAAASLRSPASPCGSWASLCVCMYAFVMNPPAIVCSPPCRRCWSLSPGLLPAGGPSSKMGRGGGRVAPGN